MVNYEGNSAAFYQSMQDLNKGALNKADDFSTQQRSLNVQHLINQYVIVEEGETKKVKTTSTETENKEYDGGSLVNERQAAVKEYLDTLVFRGIKS